MKLSIVLCTYNNADSLALTLSELSQCEVPFGWTLELICVDNNSPDNTKQTFNELKPLFNFECRYLFESKQGLSHARNLGLNSANGQYVLFTDDDAKIEKNWITEYCKIIDIQQPDCLYSKISIIWDRPKPWWYLDSYQAFFVHLDYGNEALTINDHHHEFFGKNFCVRKSLLEKFGGFDPKLGRCGDKLIAGEETLIYKNLINDNYKVVYFPNAPVGHRLKEREYEFENMKKMYTDASYSLFHISKMTSSKKLLGRPLYPLKISITQLPLNILNILKNSVLGNKSEKLYNTLLMLKHLNTIQLWIKNP